MRCFDKNLSFMTRVTTIGFSQTIKYLLRGIDIKSVFFFWFLIFLFAVLIVYNIFYHSAFQYFVLLANSFLHGHLYFIDKLFDFNDMAFYQGKYFWPEGPFPAIILMPFVAIFGLAMRHGYLSLFLTFLNFYLLFRLALKLGIQKKIDALWLAILYIFGSVYFFVALVDGSWYFAQVVATTLLLLALWEFFSKRRFWLIGILIGLGGLTRGTIYFASLFFVLYIIFDQLKWQEKIKKIFIFSMPIIISCILTFLYNYLRFEDIWEFGHNLTIFGLNLQNARSFGVFSLKHIPGNLFFFLFKGLEPVRANDISYVLKFPYFKVNPWGLGILFTSPAFIYIFLAKWKERVVKFSWFTVLFIMIPILTFYGSGVSQFGYRYALDFYPFLYLLLIWGIRPKVDSRLKTLIFISIILDFYLIFTH